LRVQKFFKAWLQGTEGVRECLTLTELGVQFVNPLGIDRKFLLIKSLENVQLGNI
jgi:hypothetical protein